MDSDVIMKRGVGYNQLEAIKLAELANKRPKKEEDLESKKRLEAQRIVKLVQEEKWDEAERNPPPLEVHDYYEEYHLTLNWSTLREIEDPRRSRDDCIYLAGMKKGVCSEIPMPGLSSDEEDDDDDGSGPSGVCTSDEETEENQEGEAGGKGEKDNGGKEKQPA